MVMTIWAMLLVDLVQPLILKLHQERGTFEGCEQCLRAASSVMDANLLLFKTVIAGDGWGTIAVPVIEAYPATAVIFVGSLLTLVFGAAGRHRSPIGVSYRFFHVFSSFSEVFR